MSDTRTAIRLAYHNSVRIEEPSTYAVKTGQVTVTDSEGNTEAFKEGDEFTIPEKGGATLFCLEQLIAYEVS